MQVDLTSFSDAAEPSLRFLAMLSGPFYPILHIVNERLVYAALYIQLHILCGCLLVYLNIVLSELWQWIEKFHKYNIRVTYNTC